jgi:PAS domain-containing protein
MEQGRGSRFGTAEFLSVSAVALVGLALIALIWLVTGRVIQDQRAEIRETADRLLGGQASTVAEAVTQELNQIDQSLLILRDAWKMNSDSVNLADWTRRFPAVMGLADDVFIADDKHVIQQDILPRAVGQGVGAAYVTFPHGALEALTAQGEPARAATLLQADAADPIDARDYLMYIIRPLDHPNGWLVGASYRSTELVRMFARASLGYNAMAALVDTRQGRLQAVVGPASRKPTVDLSKTTMYQVLQRGDPAVWLGDSGIDGVQRLHAFRRIPDRDMAVLLAASYQEVMRPADDLAAETRGVAVLASVLVAGAAGLVGYGLYAFRRHRQRQRRAERDAAELQRLRQAETTTLALAELQTARLQGLLDHGSDGVALADANDLLLRWNQRFARGIGVPLHAGLPLAGLIRQQAALGLFGAEVDPETEVARRLALLRLGEGGLPQTGGGGQPSLLRGVPIPIGGLLLILTGIAAAALEPAVEAPAEW